MSSRRRAGRRLQRRTPGLRLWRRIAALVAVSGIVVAAAASVWLLLSPGSGGPPTAAIVDQLSLTTPNQAFVEEATDLLGAAGYDVIYVPGEQVTVEFYRDLSASGYDVILLRAHAARQALEVEFADDVSLFTSERFNPNRYTEEGRRRLLTGVGYTQEDVEEGDLFYGIPPAFVESKMRGDFGGATVVLMVCDVLRAEAMAQAFVERGAGAVVGWDKSVTAPHTDAATLSLLRHFLSEDLPVQQSAEAAMADVGSDPATGAALLAYPRGP